MKKSVLILSALAMSVLSGTAMAATDDVTPQSNIRFIGAVSAMTCDLEVNVNGSVNNMIQLGTTLKNTAGTTVDFSLKPKADQTDPACDWDTDGLTKAQIGFSGPLNVNGLANQLTGTGVATDAYVEITAPNATGTQTKLVQGDATREFSKTNLTGTDGAKFQATLQGKAVAGLYQSALAFNVYYE